MTQQSEARPPMDVEEAAANLDRAMHDPSRRADAVGDLFAAPAPPLPVWEETTAEAAAWDRWWGEQEYDTEPTNPDD